MSVRPKKHLGQHFLTDLDIAQNIAGALTGLGYKDVLEVGPGMGVLTQYLLQKDYTIHAIEVDEESINYLQDNYPKLKSNLIFGDFLAPAAENPVFSQCFSKIFSWTKKFCFP